MRWHGQVLGAINFFFAEPMAESTELLVVGQAFADMATLILLTPHEIVGSDIATRTSEALMARTVVEQAKGVLAYQRAFPSRGLQRAPRARPDRGPHAQRGRRRRRP